MGGSGTTTTSGIIPPELQGLYRGSAQRLLDQQTDNPLSQYNESNPLAVEGANPLQSYGAALIGGGGQTSGLQGLALQSALRMPGLAGAGPTTGQYDYGSEAGLGDLMSFMNPSVAQGNGLITPSGLGASGYQNANPSSQAAPYSFDGLDEALHPPSSQGGGGGGFNLPGGNQGTYTGGSDMNHPLPGSYAGGVPGGGITMADIAGGGSSHPGGAPIEGPAWLRGAKQYSDWKYDANGKPIGPQGQQYTGSQHEFSGGLSTGSGWDPKTGKDSAGRQLGSGGNANPYGDDRTYTDWLSQVNHVNRAESVGLDKDATYGQIAQGYSDKNADFKAKNPGFAAQSAAILANQRGSQANTAATLAQANKKKGQ